MADRKISDLTALTTPATGDLIPIVDISEAAAADKNKSITVGELLRGAPDGTAAAPGFAFESDGGNGMFLGGTDILAFSTGGTQAVTIDASQRVGLGTSSPISLCHISGPEGTYGQLRIQATGAGEDALVAFSTVSNGRGIYLDEGDSNKLKIYAGAGKGAAGEVVIDNSGRVGIGNTGPGYNLHIGDGSATAIQRIDSSGTALLSLRAGTSSECRIEFGDSGDDDIGKIYYDNSTNSMEFSTNASERARIDSSGRLLVGTSSDLTGDELQINDAAAGAGISITGGVTADGAESGRILFRSDTGNQSRITSRNDGAQTSGSNPGRLEFATTAAAASSPTERMRITNSGTVLVGRTTNTSVSSSAALQPSNLAVEVASDTTGSWWNRTDSDAAWVAMRFYAQGSQSGFIQVNTSSVTYSTTSDYRLKENVAPLTGAADRVNQLQVHRFNFIAEPDKTVDGFLAHEAQAVVPECVTGTKDEVDDDGNPVYQGIDQSKLVPLLTAALQEALAEIESLKARVTSLEP